MKRILSLLLVVVLTLTISSSNIANTEGIELVPCVFGDSGENVSNLQTKLIELCYMDSKVTGNYLNQTKKAIENFQRDYNIAITGNADQETIEILKNAKYRNIKESYSGNDVVALQDKLKELGYLKTKSSGKYYAQTEKAIKLFQKDKGLEITGIADIKMQDELFGTNSQSLDGEEAISVEDGRSESSELIEFGKNLVRGSEGENVKIAQTKLKELGFFEGPISGYYMNKTKAAVKTFQEYNGLHATGDMDEITWNTLLNNDNVVDINSTPAPSPEPIIPKYAVTVDVKNQAVLVFEKDDSGNYSKLIRKMVCSTGTTATPSDVGDWIISGRRAKWCYFPAYGSHARYWLQINEYIAFHSVIYNSVNTMALSVKSYNKLGSRASHGCVRLLVNDAKWLYDNIDKGTVVTITESLHYDEELRFAIKPPPLNKTNMWPSSTPEPTAEPNYDGNAVPPMAIIKLKKGSSGIEVFWLQSKLKELGYYYGTVSGTYYSGTVDAVKRYQKAVGVYQDGTASVELQNVLYSDVLNNKTIEPTMSPEPPHNTPVPLILP